MVALAQEIEADHRIFCGFIFSSVWLGFNSPSGSFHDAPSNCWVICSSR